MNYFDGETFYRLQQYHNGIPVYGREIVLSANDDGEITSISSNTVKLDDNIKQINANAAKNINFDSIKNIVDSFLKQAKLELEDFLCVSLPEANYYVDVSNQVRPSIVEHITVTDVNKKGYDFKVIFDADTLEIITCSAETESATKTSASGRDGKGDTKYFTVYEDNGRYIMEDPEKNIKAYDVNGNTLVPQPAISDGNGNLYAIENGRLFDNRGNEVYLDDAGLNITDKTGNVIATDLSWDLILSSQPENNITEAESRSKTWNDRSAVMAYTRVNNAYDLYDKVLNRHGFDGNNGKLYVCFNDYNSGDVTNAYSYTVGGASVITFGTENEINYDTVGHEYTHSVINSIVELDYNGESGALHEAYADIFGEIAEDYSDGSLNNSCNWVESNFRNLIDPSEDGNPTVYEGDNWHDTFSLPDYLKNSPLSIIDLFTDNGGVHSNCTVISHAAYLMNQGIDGNERYKIDTELLAKIWHRSMFSLHTDETFEQCANHVYDAATRTSGVSVYQLECIKKAFEMAGLNIQKQIAPTVQRGTVINVVDANGGKHGSYHITIEDFFSGEKAVDADVTSNRGYVLNIDAGTYTMTITDNSGKSDTAYEKALHVTDSLNAARNPYINIFTDF